MADSADNLPRWVTKADGRLAPFDADRIHRALFAASESLGQPDPFLARELTDSVLHFLADEADPIASSRLAEQIAKVVRELGQPALAHAFSQSRDRTAAPTEPAAVCIDATTHPLQWLRELAAPALRACSLSSVYGPELAAAHRDGLLLLTGLEHPAELAAEIVAPMPHEAQRWPDCIMDARARVGHAVIIDGPEYHSAGGDFVRELGWGLTATGLAAVVNLNVPSPPAWAEAAEGPLFAGQTHRPARAELDQASDRLLDALAKRPGLRIDWHLGERDFRADQASRLLRIARRASEGQPLAFVFDRAKGQTLLAEGIDRRHPALLLNAGLSLPALAARVGRGDADQFVGKLGSLARLALSAAVQKRDFLRRTRPALGSGFLLDRARLVVTPIGLDAATRLFMGKGLAEDDAGLPFARQVVQELQNVLAREGGRRQLDCILDAAFFGLLPGQETCSGPLRHQLRVAAALHGRATTARLTAERRPGADELADLLRFAWQQTQVARLIVERLEATEHRLDFPA